MPEGAHEQRAMLVADVELPGDKNFAFISTHLDHSSSDVRVAQVQALNYVISEIKLPVIVAGDFNARPDSPEIKEGMKDYLQLCNDEFTIPSGNPRSKIDYIFGKPVGQWKKIEAHTPKVPLSDHLPVVSVVKLFH